VSAELVAERLGRGEERLSGAGRMSWEATSSRMAVYGALDLGTNNCRLLIARPSVAGGFRVIDAFSRIVRLGEGVSRTRLLSEDAMERTLGALRVCGSKLERRGVTTLRAVATEACRRARNCADFVERAASETGIRIEIITVEEEARLAVASCAPLLEPHMSRALVFDIGGGSTELMWLAVERNGRPRLIDQISVPHGVVCLSEEYGGDLVPKETYRSMVAKVAASIACFETRNRIGRHVDEGRVQMIGTSGTVTTLAGIHRGLPRYERSLIDGTWLEVAHARLVIDRLLDLDFASRAAYPCIGHERADLVIAGCAVLDAITDTWPVKRLRIADRGLREGILVDLIGT
jgi:exopolyphosphatase / guanosine-5'-triphosphate,3'-diphosphate pyrophosphatase